MVEMNITRGDWAATFVNNHLSSPMVYTGDATGYLPIASVFNDRNPEQANANAAAICIVPELVAIAGTLLRHTPDDCPVMDLQDMARAAFAKARGETP